MRNTFKVLFYIKKNAPLKNGQVRIMGRITINGLRTQFSTQIAVDPLYWNASTGRLAGRNSAATRINEQLAAIRYHIERCYNALFHTQKHINPQKVKDMYLGLNNHQESIISFFTQHNEEFRTMVGVSRSKSTYYKYRCVCNRLSCFIEKQFSRKDLSFKELDRKFLTEFHAYILHECAYKKNTAWIYMIALKHILMLARSKGYLNKDLFTNYRLHNEFVMRNYLDMNEINRIATLQCNNPTMQLVRDAFLFSCFTGLSYVDICELTGNHISQDGNNLWINTLRRKTGSEVYVRLFSVSQAIIQNYRSKDLTATIFKLPSNGWCNVCLSKIVTQVGIDRRITFHSARHTFATTITLSQGVAIETISKLLGHKNIRTTQIYATITHARLDSEMEQLSKRIDSLCLMPQIKGPNDRI